MGDRAHAVHQGDRPSIQRAVVGGAAVPGPQRVLVPRRQRRRAQGRSSYSKPPGSTTSRLPVVITEKGETLVEPTDVELATLLGLSTSPQLEMYDLAVIGGGPAGLAAAVYGASEGLKTVLIEKATTGGQAGRSSKIENYLGFRERHLRRRPDDVGAPPGRDVSAPRSSRPRRPAGSRSTVSARPTRYAQRRQHHRRARRHPRHGRRLPPAADHRMLGRLPTTRRCNYIGRGVFYGASVSDNSECAGEDVYIVGGANSAGQAAMYMSRDRQIGDHADPWSVAGGGHVAVPGRPDPQDPEHHGPDLHRGRRHRCGGRPPVRAGATRQAHRGDRDGHLRSDVLLHRRDTPYRLARGSGNSPRRSRLHPVGTRSVATSRGGRWTVRRTTWKQVCRVCLLQEMCVRSPRSGLRPLSAKGRWR